MILLQCSRLRQKPLTHSYRPKIPRLLFNQKQEVLLQIRKSTVVPTSRVFKHQ